MDNETNMTEENKTEEVTSEEIASKEISPEEKKRMTRRFVSGLLIGVMCTAFVFMGIIIASLYTPYAVVGGSSILDDATAQKGKKA